MARSIRILDDDQEEPSVPILGHVAAGHPIHVEETPEHVRLEELLRLRSGCYLLRVTGTSMIDSHICDGDYVLVDPGARPENGQMVIAALEEGDVTLKRFHREKGRIRLQPANSALKPIYTKKLDLRGVVVGVLRRV